MKSMIETTLAVYLMVLVVAIFAGTISRIDGNNCRIVVADYVFLGLTRLPCEVK